MKNIFLNYNQTELFEQIRLRLLLLKDTFKEEDEFNNIIEETLLIAYQEEKKLDADLFFVLFEKVQEDLRRDAELEFNQER